MHSPSDCVIELNCVARSMRVDGWSAFIPSAATWDEVRAIGRSCLLRFWKEDGHGSLAPEWTSSERNPIPDEVVIRAPDGRALYRRSIVEEKMARWFEAK